MSPYAGYGGRAIKALSADAVADLIAGRGLEYALAAELNGYPGPRHVLDLADALELDAAQRISSAGRFAAMQTRAGALGRAIVDAEAALDRAFATATITTAELRQRTAAIAALEGELRAVHLEAHLAERALLSAAQIARYGELRGYSARHPRR